MAELNLRTTQVDNDNIQVSWNDIVLPEFEGINGTLWGLIAGVGVIFGLIFSVGFETVVPGVIGVLIFIFSLIMFKSSRSVQKQITIGSEITAYEGRRYPTQQITRFDYGLRSQLTGRRPVKDGKGNEMADPMLIRMWLDDSSPITLSTNNWQNQVNHEIRDELEKALLTMRRSSAEAEREQKYGRVTSDGIPDYD